MLIKSAIGRRFGLGPWLSAVSCALALAGCGLMKKAPPPPPPPAPVPVSVALKVSLSADGNPDASGRASPLVVRVYALRGDDTFRRLELEDLEGHDDYKIALNMNAKLAAHEIIRILGSDLRSGPVAVLYNCNQHLKKNPGHITAFIRRGLSLLLLGRDAAASDDFEEVYKQLPEVRPPGVFLHHIDEEKRYREKSPILAETASEKPPTA